MHLKWFLVLVGLALGLAQPSGAQSLRFFGSGANAPDLDRVKIRIDDPATSLPGPPADVGATDFTIEMWLKGDAAQNATGSLGCGANYDSWTTGSIFYDRDRHTQSPGFGIALKNGRIMFAVNGRVNGTSVPFTVCSTGSILDNQWHHVAFTRALGGQMRIFIDGQPDGTGMGPPQDLSYPDNGVPGNFCSGSCANSDPFIVLGAEKHDAGVQFRAYSGFMDELRISTTLRYSGAFAPPTVPFTVDAQTAALYHFDENTGIALNDANGNQSPGVLRVGGSQNGPQWRPDTPFAPSAGSIQMQSGAASITETAGGTTLTLNVVRTGTVGAATVDYATADGTAQAGSDYTARSATLNWANGVDGAQSIQIPILDDSTFESPETFSLNLSNATGATLANPMATSVTINDNDAAPQAGALQFSAASYSTPEAAGNATITVTRSGGSDGAVSVSYAATGGTATSGADYTLAAGTLSWASGDAAAKTFTVAINPDGSIEPSETVNLTLSGPTNGATIGAIGSAALTILDDDSTLRFSSATYSVSEAGPSVALSVTRTGSANTLASLSYATANGTAAAPGDFTATNGTLTWNAGDGAAKSITVPITDDTAFEPNETFTVTLGSPTGAVLVAPSTATVTINDNDQPVPGVLQFAVPAYFAAEGEGTLTISATRSGGTDGPVSVQYSSAGGSATPGSDYTAVSGTLSWADGDNAPKTFDVAITSDTSVESTETINLALSAPGGGASLGTTSSTVVNIDDDDSTLQFSPATYTVAESGGAATLTVTRTGSSIGAASVNFTTANGSADGTDFTATAGTLSWAASDADPKTLSVMITDDAANEGSETFVVQLSGASGATLGAALNAGVTIDASDQPVAGTVQLSSAAYTATEGAGNFVVTVTRSVGALGPATVNYAASDGTATSPADYGAASGTLSWGNNDATSKTFTVVIVDDATQEAVETINLTLSSETGASLGAPSTAVINISANDAPPPPAGTLRFTSATHTPSEGGGSVTLTVSRVGGSAGAASVQFQTANGTASAGADYVAKAGTLNWGAGNSTDRFIEVTLTDDTAFESNETFMVNLVTPMGATLGSPSTSTVTITDNDVAQRGTLQFVPATPTVAESAGTVSLLIERVGGADGAVSLTFATSNGTATSPNDYTAVTQTVTWANGDAAQKTVSVPITNDSQNEPAENFTAAISAPAGGAALGNPTSITIAVNDDDAPPPPQEGSSGGGSLGYSGLLLSVLLAWRRRFGVRSQRASGAC